MAETTTDEVVLQQSEEIISSQARNSNEDRKKHILKKRTAFCFPKRRKDIYVTNRTNFKAQLNKCEKLLDSGETEIIVHGLGAAITRACSLALQLRNNHHGTLDLDINTATVDLIGIRIADWAVKRAFQFLPFGKLDKVLQITTGNIKFFLVIEHNAKIPPFQPKEKKSFSWKVEC